MHGGGQNGDISSGNRGISLGVDEIKLILSKLNEIQRGSNKGNDHKALDTKLKLDFLKKLINS